MQSLYQPDPTSPQPSGALAIIGFIAGIVAFLCGWIPFVGLVLDIVGLLLSILAVRKPKLRGLAVTGIVLSTSAALTSLVTTSLFVIALPGSSDTAPDPEVAAASSPGRASSRSTTVNSRASPRIPTRTRARH